MGPSHAAGQARWTLRVLARELETWGIVPRIHHATVRCVLKNELTPWRRVQRGYPPEADFVIRGKRGETSTASSTLHAIR